MMQRNGLILAIVFVVLCMLAAYFGYYYFLYLGFSGSDQAELKGVRSGTFGDAFGVLNALFSGLAFSGVVATLLIQSKDLNEARAQSARQQIESQFYNLLGLQQNVIQGFNGNSTTVGRDSFRIWVVFLKARYEESSNVSKPQELAYQKLWDKYRGDLSLYFRSLYSVFRFVSESGHVDTKKFGVAARSLLSDFELVVLFYNCIDSRGIKFQRFANEFALFNNLDPALLLREVDVKMLAKEAYGNNEEVLSIYSAT